VEVVFSNGIVQNLQHNHDETKNNVITNVDKIWMYFLYHVINLFEDLMVEDLILTHCYLQHIPYFNWKIINNMNIFMHQNDKMDWAEQLCYIPMTHSYFLLFFGNIISIWWKHITGFFLMLILYFLHLQINGYVVYQVKNMDHIEFNFSENDQKPIQKSIFNVKLLYLFYFLMGVK